MLICTFLMMQHIYKGFFHYRGPLQRSSASTVVTITQAEIEDNLFPIELRTLITVQHFKPVSRIYNYWRNLPPPLCSSSCTLRSSKCYVVTSSTFELTKRVMLSGFYIYMPFSVGIILS